MVLGGGTIPALLLTPPEVLAKRVRQPPFAGGLLGLPDTGDIGSIYHPLDRNGVLPICQSPPDNHRMTIAAHTPLTAAGPRSLIDAQTDLFREDERHRLL